jgi:HAD superfamily hydrolase (TIGR01484 family)
LQPLTAEALQSVRLIATDMDGTLTRQEKFTPVLLQTLNDLAQAQIPVLIVTGRSAGWVNGLVHYLPVAGAIAENGGLFYVQSESQLLISIPDLNRHRQQLAQMFQQLQQEFPQIQESSDNAFRLTDWTFDVQGLSLDDLQHMADRCQEQGWGFTYSTVQCHIKQPEQEKAAGLHQVLARYFPDLTPDQVVTVGDSPNDQSLFDRSQFPLSVGVANLKHYADQMAHRPTYLTQQSEVDGFCQLAQAVIRQLWPNNSERDRNQTQKGEKPNGI